MIDHIPDGNLFPMCSRVLNERGVPTHYADLAREAASRILGGEQFEDRRVIEDVRERMLEIGRFGTGYTGRPHCLGFKRAWFARELIPSEPILIPAHISPSFAAGVESVLRIRFMLNKFGYTEKTRAENVVRGLIIQHHVSDWFRVRFKGAWMPADNEGQWNKWCGHDFKLLINGRVIGVDVSGEKRSGLFGAPPNKPPAGLHIHARLDEGRNLVEMISCVKPEDFSDIVEPWREIHAGRLSTFLFLESQGIPRSVFNDKPNP